MSYVSEWVKNIFIIIIVISFIETLMPGGTMEKYIRYIFSLIILAAILSPLAYILLE